MMIDTRTIDFNIECSLKNHFLQESCLSAEEDSKDIDILSAQIQRKTLMFSVQGNAPSFHRCSDSSQNRASVHCSSLPQDSSSYGITCHNIANPFVHQLPPTNGTFGYNTVPSREFSCTNNVVSMLPTYDHSALENLNYNLHPNLPNMPELARQTSLSMAIEVLEACQNEERPTTQGLFNSIMYPPTPSPSLQEEDRYSCNQFPLDHLTIPGNNVPTRNRTQSECVEFSTPRYGTYGIDGNHARAASVDCSGIYTHPTTYEEEHCPHQEYANSKSSLLDPAVFVENSLETSGFINDIIASTDEEQLLFEVPQETERSISKDESTIASSTFAEQASSFDKKANITNVEMKHVSNSCKKESGNHTDLQAEEESCTSPNNAQASDQFSLKSTLSYNSKRNRNNEACRQSRKKRKMQRSDMESKVVNLQEENESLKKKIVELEAGVTELRKELFARVGANQRKS